MPTVLLGKMVMELPPKSVPLSSTPSQLTVRKPPACGDGLAPLSTPPMAALKALKPALLAAAPLPLNVTTALAGTGAHRQSDASSTLAAMGEMLTLALFTPSWNESVAWNEPSSGYVWLPVMRKRCGSMVATTVPAEGLVPSPQLMLTVVKLLAITV